MAWQTIASSRQESLSAWLRAQGFADAVSKAVQQGKLDAGEIERLKQLRSAACGPGGALSKAQRSSCDPSKVALKTGKLTNLSLGALPGGKRKHGGAPKPGAGSASEVTALKQQIAELTALVKQRQQPASAANPEDIDMTAAEAAKPTSGKGKACHVCGSREHLKADCPSAQEISRVEAWLVALQRDSCLLPPEVQAQQVLEANARLDALKAEIAQAKEQSVLPEHCLSTRRAEAKKCCEALADARRQLEQHEGLLTEMQTEAERLRQLVSVKAKAYKLAETALEDAQRRFAESVVPSGGPTTHEPQAPAAAMAMPAAPSLSAQGAAAMDGLMSHLQHLGSATSVKEAEEAHRHAVAAAEAEHRDPPTLLAFVLEFLGTQGLKQLEMIRFDLSKATRDGPVEPAAPPDRAATTCQPAPAAPPDRPAATCQAQARPLVVDEEDAPRLPARETAKAIPAKADAGARAANLRKEARRLAAAAAEGAAAAEAAEAAALDMSAEADEPDTSRVDPLGR